MGDKYWCVGGGGDVYHPGWSGDTFDIGCQEQNNIYQTEKEAEMAVIRDRGMKVKNTAKKGENFWCWSFEDNKHKHIDSEWYDVYTLDRKFKTEEEAQAWGGEYAEAFIALN